MEYFELWRGGVKLVKTENAMPVTTDSVLLGDFAAIPKKAKICDLGAGSGILALTLLYRSPSSTAALAELDSAACETALENIALNGMSDRAEVMNIDLRKVRGRYDLVISNPPYFALSGGVSPNESRNLRRLENSASLEDVAEAASRLLGDGGKFTFVYPAQRLTEAVQIVSRNRLEPKRLRLVQAHLDARPSVFLMECVKAGKPGLTALPVLILQNPDGSDTDEVKRIYHLGDL